MFTFIKRLQELPARLKKNKGLWFTTITTVSIIGIFVCMLTIMTMTDRVSKEVYESMASSYEKQLNASVSDKRQEFEKMLVSIRQNGILLNAIENNNVTMMNAVKNFLNEEFAKNGFTDLSIDILNVLNRDVVFRNTINTVINSNRSLYGTEVLNEGVFMVYLFPLERDGQVYGVLEFKESIHTIREDFTPKDQEFVFILDKKMLPFIALESATFKVLIFPVYQTIQICFKKINLSEQNQ